MTLNLLVSVRDLAEAEIAMEEKVDWIDLKDPLSGSLGRPSREILATVGAFLQDHPQRSVAMGELGDLPADYVVAAARYFPFVKVGLSGQLSSTRAWRIRLIELAGSISSLGASLVPVVYADHLHCQAPSVEDVFEFARKHQCKFLLIDTFFKDGKSLLDWINPSELIELNKQAVVSGIGMVLAGSLRPSDFPKVIKCDPAAIAVRSAACIGSRTGSISRERIVGLKNAISMTDTPFITPAKTSD